MKSITYYYLLTLFSLLGLVAVIIAWNGWLTTTQAMPRSLEIGIFCVPLLLFLRGVLNGKRGIYVSLMVVAFFYFLMGVWHIIDPLERAYGIVIVLLSLALYLGGYFYAKQHDKIAQQLFDDATSQSKGESQE